MGLDHSQIALLCAMSIYTRTDGSIMLTPEHLALKMDRSTQWIEIKLKKLIQVGLVGQRGERYEILYSPLSYSPLLVESNNTREVLSNTISTNLNARSKERTNSISTNFKMTDKLQEWASEKLFTIDLKIETEKFKNHAEATNRKQSRWDAAWRNWMLQAQQYADERKPNESRNKRPEPIEVAQSIRAAKERVSSKFNS